MKSSFLPVAVLAAGIGAVMAAGAVILFTGSTAERPRVQAANPLAAAPDLSAEVAELRARNDELLARIEALEQRPVAALPVRESVPITDADFEDEVRRWMASLQGDSGEAPEAFMANVESALDRIRDEEDLERRDRMQQMQAERLEERLEELAVELQLAPHQVDEMRKVLTAQNLRQAELWQTGWESGDRGSIREQMQTIREETTKSLSVILSPEQLEGYQSSQRDQWRGGFGGGPGGGRGGRPPGQGRGGR